MNRHYKYTARHGTLQIVRAVLVTLLLTVSVFTLAMPVPVGARTSVPPLGTAGSFGVLAGSSVSNTGSTTVTGDLGVSPGTAISGFPPGVASGTIHAGDAVAGQAQNDATVAYNNAAGRPCDTNLTGQDLGGLTLVPGVYCFASSAQLTGQLTLDGQGSTASVFIFQIGSTLTTASNAGVSVINGAQPCRIFWQVGSSATLGTNTDFQGNILALTSISLNTGATTNTGLYALNGAVTLDTNDIQACASGAVPTNTSTVTATRTARPPTNTATPSATNTLVPVPTNTTEPAATNTPANTATATNTLVPVSTDTTIPNITNTPTNTALATNTSVPRPTTVPIDTPTIALTNTPGPSTTSTPPNTAVPANTEVATDTPSDTAIPENTEVSTSVATEIATNVAAGTPSDTDTTTPTNTVTLLSPTAVLTSTPLSTQTAGGPSTTSTPTIVSDTPTQTIITETPVTTTQIAAPTVALQPTTEAMGTVASPKQPVLLPSTGGGLSWLSPAILLFSMLLLAVGLGMRKLFRMRSES